MNRMKTHARVRRATSKTPGSVVKARVFFLTPRSAHFVIYVVDKGVYAFLRGDTPFCPPAGTIQQRPPWNPFAGLPGDPGHHGIHGVVPRGVGAIVGPGAWYHGEKP